MVEARLESSLHIAWPIKLLKQLCDENRLVEMLFKALDFSDVALDQQKVDKNYDILCHLMDYKIPSSLSTKIPELFVFLSAHDERLRFAATEVLLEQATPKITPRLESFLLDDTPENTRLRQAVISGFIKNGWTITRREDLPRGSILPGARVTDDFTLKATD